MSDHSRPETAPGSGDTGRGAAPLEPAEVAPLMRALGDPAEPVRTAAWRALVRLPLGRELWYEASERMLVLLAVAPTDDRVDRPAAPGIPREELIAAAARLPTQAVRQRLRELARAGADEDDRRRVALALASVGDGAALPQLVADLANPSGYLRTQAAEQLTRLDTTPALDTLRERFRRSDDGEERFWLALALARAGDAAVLERVLTDLEAGTAELPFLWGDPTVVTERLRGRGPFPAATGELLRRFLERDDPGPGRQVAADLLIGAEPPAGASRAAAATEAGGQAVEPASGRGTDDALRLRRAIELADRYLERSPFAEGGFPGPAELEALRDLPTERASALVTALVAQLVEEPADRRFWAGNSIVELVGSLRERFVPDVAALFDSYMRLRREGPGEGRPLSWQLGWVMSRAGLRPLLVDLAPRLSSDDEAERLAAARLVEDAARYVRQSFGPIFGGGEGPGDVAPPELLDEGGPTTTSRARPPASTAQPVDPERLSFGIGGGVGAPPVLGRSGAAPVAGPPARAGDPGRSGAAPVEESRPARLPEAERVVNTGFTDRAHPAERREPTLPLGCGQELYFWLDVGRRDERSIETESRGLPVELLPPTARLVVVLFAPSDGFVLTPGAEAGELELRPDGSAVVAAPAARPDGLSPRDDLIGTRLFFPVRAPDRPGTFRLRCNIYYRHVLVQSRLIRARVARRPRPTEHALRSTLDYTLSRSLDGSHLAGLTAHRLSVLTNANGDGTHSFLFHGEQKLDRSASFDALELQGLIEQARGALRLAAWGDRRAWQPDQGMAYRYTGGRDLERLRGDLVALAKAGFYIYDAIVDRLSGNADLALADLMRTPGIVQIASKESPRYLVPAGLIYDYRLDPTARPASYSLCPAFLAALDAAAPLDQSVCFQGGCPSRDVETAVCPSGFWGFRHFLGMPVSVATGRDAPLAIGFSATPRLAVAFSTDPGFVMRADHVRTLRALRPDLGYAETRDEAIQVLREPSPHAVYFFCHGGVDNDVPYIQVGPLDERGINLAYLRRTKRVRWEVPRPLVFINGCHTTALEPEQAFEFVSGLVETAGAAGVIGTEVTVFEPLARDFAEEFFRRFLAGQPVGEAVRGARLRLLQGGNPLGLVYVPFALATLRLEEQDGGT